MIKSLPQIHTHDGSVRKVGIEIEFSGIKLIEAVDAVAAYFGGTVKKKSAYTYIVASEKYGDFIIECDSSFLKDRQIKNWLESIGIRIPKKINKRIDKELSEMSDIIVPNEVTTPPFQCTDLKKFENLTDLLSDLKAKSDHTPISLAPCGLHINVEAIEISTREILPILQSFILHYDRLVERVDTIRRLAPYITDYPRKYKKLIMASSYLPSTRQLFIDYLKHNPTRNRALDLTPIIAHYDRGLIDETPKIEKNLIKARPAFHYRLPNCHLEDQRWKFHQEWNEWVKLEETAKQLKTHTSSKTALSSPVNLGFR